MQLDLLLQSGWLQEAAEIEVLDAIAENLSPADALERAAVGAWDFILFLTGEKSRIEDQSFVAALADRLPEAQFFASGDVVFFRGDKPFSEYSNLKGIVTDFAADGMSRFIKGERGRLPGLRYLSEQGDVVRELAVNGALQYPLPVHDAFPTARYALPFGAPGPFASVLTNYGCPYPCSYCNAKDVGFRKRDVDAVLAELAVLKESGFKKIYFRDPTFATDRQHGLAICEGMVERELCFEWNAFSRPDILDGPMLEVWLGAGAAFYNLVWKHPIWRCLQSIRRPLERIRFEPSSTIATRMESRFAAIL